MPKKLTYKPSANGKNSKGQTYWRVKKGLKVNGKPDWQPFGIDLNAALAFCEKLKLRDQLNGAVELEWLSNQNVNDIRWAHSKLAEVGVSLKSCVESFLKQNYPDGGSILVGVAAKEFLKSKKEQEVKQTYYQKLSFFLDAFAASFDKRFLHTITTVELEDYFKKIGSNWGTLTLRENKKLLIQIYNAWQKKGWLAKDVAHAASGITVSKRKVDRTPKLATSEDASEMLMWFCGQANKREKSKEGINVAESIYGVVFQLVLVMFGGTRRSEAACIDWGHVNFKKNHIRIPADISKTGRVRIIPLLGNLLNWLKFLKQKNADCPVETNVPERSVMPKPLQRLRYRQKQYRESFKKRGVPIPAIAKYYEDEDDSNSRRDVTHNILRHSFVSYHLELHKNVHQTAKQAGHSIRVEESTYEETVEDPDSALHWFSIQPPEVFKDDKSKTTISSFEEAATVERKIEHLKTLGQSEELKNQIQNYKSKLNVWLKSAPDNVHALAKFREWSDDGGHVQKRNEEGKIIWKELN